MKHMELCNRCQQAPAHPEAFGLCVPCDDALFDFMGIESDAAAADAVSQTCVTESSKRPTRRHTDVPMY
jgi:hypothetical protein